jgi:hypothetical protein
MVRKIFRKTNESKDDIKKMVSDEATQELPGKAPEMSEEQKVFVEWANDWFQRNQYYAGINDVASMNINALLHQNLLFQVGMAQNSDLIIDELRRLNKNIRELSETLQEVVEDA